MYVSSPGIIAHNDLAIYACFVASTYAMCIIIIHIIYVVLLQDIVDISTIRITSSSLSTIDINAY